MWLAASLPLSLRTVFWAGHLWDVHASDVPVGAGPNRWTNTAAAVHVEGPSLLLTLQEDAVGWQAVELSTPVRRRPRAFEVELEVGSLDSRVVGGVFFYKDDTSEIDLEVARWGDPDAAPFQYAVAPADTPDLLHRFEMAAGRSRHRMRWRRRSIAWWSVSADRISRWTLRGPRVPRFDGHRLHLNLWVLDGGTPAGDGELSIRIVGIRME